MPRPRAGRRSSPPRAGRAGGRTAGAPPSAWPRPPSHGGRRPAPRPPGRAPRAPRSAFARATVLRSGVSTNTCPDQALPASAMYRTTRGTTSPSVPELGVGRGVGHGLRRGGPVHALARQHRPGERVEQGRLPRSRRAHQRDAERTLGERACPGIVPGQALQQRPGVGERRESARLVEPGHRTSSGSGSAAGGVSSCFARRNHLMLRLPRAARRPGRTWLPLPRRRRPAHRAVRAAARRAGPRARVRASSRALRPRRTTSARTPVPSRSTKRSSSGVVSSVPTHTTASCPTPPVTTVTTAAALAGTEYTSVASAWMAPSSKPPGRCARTSSRQRARSCARSSRSDASSTSGPGAWRAESVGTAERLGQRLAGGRVAAPRGELGPQRLEQLPHAVAERGVGGRRRGGRSSASGCGGLNEARSFRPTRAERRGEPAERPADPPVHGAARVQLVAECLHQHVGGHGAERRPARPPRPARGGCRVRSRSGSLARARHLAWPACAARRRRPGARRRGRGCGALRPARGRRAAPRGRARRPPARRRGRAGRPRPPGRADSGTARRAGRPRPRRACPGARAPSPARAPRCRPRPRAARVPPPAAPRPPARRSGRCAGRRRRRPRPPSPAAPRSAPGSRAPRCRSPACRPAPNPRAAWRSR